MTAQDKIESGAPVKETPTGLALLRAPFPPHHISKLPKPTKAQTDAVRQDFKKGVRCNLCGGWHHPQVVHLDYVGHAALTDRLLDADPAWNWEPLTTSENGTPVLDQNNGMWIKLTVCGQSRLGYGHAEGKRGGDAVKEVIGDALRNAAMRFGAALDLWHKGELHAVDGEAPSEQDQSAHKPAEKTDEERRDWVKAKLAQIPTQDALRDWWTGDKIAAGVAALPEAMRDELEAEYERLFDAMSQPDNSDLADEIPY